MLRFSARYPSIYLNSYYLNVPLDEREKIAKQIDELQLQSYDDSVYNYQIHKPQKDVINRPYQFGYSWMVENNGGQMPSNEQVRQSFFNIIRLYLSEKKKGREW